MQIKTICAALALALIAVTPRPANAVTATLIVHYFSGSGTYAQLACVCTLTSGFSTWYNVTFHVGLVGYWTSDSGALHVGTGGAGDHRYPNDPNLYVTPNWSTKSPQTGTFDLWAVAHGVTTNYPNPRTEWWASTGDHYESYP